MAYIIIADDDDIIAEMASGVLMDAGHACGWVSDGQAAVELLEWRRPDLLLLDQDMPGMSGTAVLRKLRGSPDYYDLPVMMFTAMNGAEDELQALYNGAQDYIRKPFDPKFLVWRVSQLLRSRDRHPQHTELKDAMMRQSGKEPPDLDENRAMV